MAAGGKDIMCRIFLLCFHMAVGGIIFQSSQRDRSIGIKQTEEKQVYEENTKKTRKQLLMVKTEENDEKGESMKDIFKIRQKHVNKMCHEYKDIKQSRSKRFTSMKMSSQKKTKKKRRERLDHQRQIHPAKLVNNLS